jgi:hypothetical protein
MKCFSILPFCLSLAAACSLAGCGESLSTRSQQGDAEGPGGHAAAHHHPPHKPRDFPSGLAAVHERLDQLFNAPDVKSPASDKEFGKLVDIVGWLPELAADSDLDRAEWDRVNEQSKQLARHVDEFAHAGSDDVRPRIRQRIELAVQALDDVARRHADMFAQSGRPGTSHDQHVESFDHPQT